MPVGFTHVIGNHVQTAKGEVLADGEIWFQPISTFTRQPIAFRTGGTNALTFEEPVCADVEDGQFAIDLADTSLTNPLNIAYRVWIKDNTSGRLWLLPGYGDYQPTGTEADIDDWEPDVQGLATIQRGPEGPPGLPGGVAGAVIGETDLSGPIDGTNLVYSFAGVPAAYIYVVNGLIQRKGRDYFDSRNSSTGITTITRYVPLQPAQGSDPTDTHWIELGITSSNGQAGSTGGGATTAPAPALLPLLDSSGPVVALRIVRGQLDPIVVAPYTGTAPTSGYILIDTQAQTAWQIQSIDMQPVATYFAAVPPLGTLSSLSFTDVGDASTRTLTIAAGQIVIT